MITGYKNSWYIGIFPESSVRNRRYCSCKKLSKLSERGHPPCNISISQSKFKLDFISRFSLFLLQLFFLNNGFLRYNSHVNQFTLWTIQSHGLLLLFSFFVFTELCNNQYYLILSYLLTPQLNSIIISSHTPFPLPSTPHNQWFTFYLQMNYTYIIYLYIYFVPIISSWLKQLT